MLRVMIACVTGVLVSVAAFAGELTPPAGAIEASDAVLLNEQWTTLPYTITEPGLYKLTSNLTGVAGQHGILVGSDNVTIDLNGFSLVGVAGSLDGIAPNIGIGFTSYSHMVIHDGVITKWGGTGVNGFDSDGFNDSFFRISTVRGVTVSECGGLGLSLPGGGVIESCIITQCSDGISLSDGVVKDCVVLDCSGTGIGVGGGTLIEDCVVRGGSTGIEAHRSLVVGCVVSSTTTRGILAQNRSTVRDNMLESNTGSGIVLSAGGVNRCHIEGNSIIENGLWGIDAGASSGNRIYRNTLVDNTSGAINPGAGNDAPISATSVGAGPLDNIGN